MKFVPTATPAPATLQTCTKPVLGVEGSTVPMNVTMVCTPAFTVTVAVPAAKLLLTSNPPGRVLTPANVMPTGNVSVITVAPAGTTNGGLQVPPGAGPAATTTEVPATLNVKFVPTVTPAPATLQICTKPVVGGALQNGIETTLVSSVTAPFKATARPKRFTPVVRVTLASAKMFPMNCVVVPSVAELPIWKNTLQAVALLISKTEELLAVVRVLPIWKMKTALGLP